MASTSESSSVVHKFWLTAPTWMTGLLRRDELFTSGMSIAPQRGAEQGAGYVDVPQGALLEIEVDEPGLAPDVRVRSMPFRHRLGEFYTRFASLLYGKRFRYHGYAELDGMPSFPDARVTNMPSPGAAALRYGIYGNAPRADMPVRLNYTSARPAIRAFDALLWGKPESPDWGAGFVNAISCYHDGVDHIESAPEVAFVLFVSAIESVRDYHPALNKIATQTSKFVELLSTYCGDSFFSGVPLDGPTVMQLAKHPAREVYLSVYRTRSRFLHRGERFNDALDARKYVMLGYATPPFDEGDTAQDWPRLPGVSTLEQIARRILLRFFLDRTGVEHADIAPVKSDQHQKAAVPETT